jgi:hypothetical protein
LTDDQNTAARSLGGDTQLLEYGKALVNQRKAVEDQFVMLFGKDLDKSMSQMLATGTERLAKGDADSFKKIMQAVPTELRPQVAASAVSSMMLKRAKNGELNMEQFANWYGAVKRNKVAHQALLGSMTIARKHDAGGSHWPRQPSQNSQDYHAEYRPKACCIRKGCH